MNVKRASTTVAFLGLALAACGGSPERPQRTAGPAVWVDPESASLELAALDALRDAGVTDLFLPAGRIAWTGSGVARAEPDLPPAPRRQPATLAVSGAWPPAAVAEGDPEAAAEALAVALRELGLAAEGAGWLPTGYHLPAPEGDLAVLAELTAALRERLETSLLSLELDRRRLDAPDLDRLARAADFVVCSLYGQRPDEREDAAAWRRADALSGAHRLAELGAPFLAGVVTVGSVAALEEKGGVAGATSRGSLGRLARNPALELSKKWIPEAMDRRLTRFEVVRGLRLDGVEVRPGQQLRAAFLAPRDVLEFARPLAAAHAEGDLEGYLGVLFYRLAGPEEGFSLSLPALTAVARGENPAPGLEISVEKTGAGPSVQVTVANRGSSPTGVALLEHNFVEVIVDRGRVARVDNGGFRRAVLGRGESVARTMEDYRSADRVRLFVPALDPGEEVTSGLIVLAGAGTVSVSGTFLSSDGTVVEIPPQAVP